MITIEKYLSNYTKPIHRILSCQLTFTIIDEYTVVENIIEFHRQKQGETSLLLNGENLELMNISIDGNLLLNSQYSLDHESLILKDLPEIFTLKITTKIYPELNTALEGLFKS